MKVILHDDGTWDLEAGGLRLEGAYPMAMGRPFRTIRVKREESSLCYEGPEGTLHCEFLQKEGSLVLRSRLEGASRLHDISPLGMARVILPEERRVSRAFVQGLGMEGPSGLMPLEGSLTSHGLLAVEESGGDTPQFFFCHATDHRHFDNRYGLKASEGLFGSGEVLLEAGFDLEGTREGDFSLPDVSFFEGELEAGLRSCAEDIAREMGAGLTKPPAYHWCSWYYKYMYMSQDLLEDYLPSFREHVPGFRYIQLDQGYSPDLGDWLLPSPLYPEGIEKAAADIREAGFLPGIWVGPFMVGSESVLYREHPDWVLKKKDGKPLVKIESYNEPKVFGLPDCEYYCLDASHPGALAYLKEVFETLYRWGFRLFKTDFMLFNSVDTSQVARYDSSLTSFEVLRRVLGVIREAIGEESYLLGCIAPFLPFVGYADGMRIAGDVGASWKGVYGPTNLLRELMADNYFNLVYWQNDPDAILLRDYEVYLSEKEVESLALLQALSGGVITTSEDVGRLSEKRRQLLRFLRPEGFHKARFPFLAGEREELVLTQDLPQGKLVYVLNPTDRPLSVLLDLRDLSGEDWQEDFHVLRCGESEWHCQGGMLGVRLSSHESALWFVSRKSRETVPENLWVW